MKLLTAVMISAGLLTPGLVFSQPVAAPAAQQSAAAPVKVTSVEGLTEYRLSNGLRVVLFPDASKPTITSNLVYQVGSRHENYGETGMAHLLEHLLFKPSANFGIKPGSKSPVEVMNGMGAQFNASTSSDRTNYYATYPANEDNLRLILTMEADRMLNASVRQEDLWDPKTQKGEMTVVRNEFERGESNPIGVTMERIVALAYDWHNYGKSTIGTRSDIELVNIPRLRAFYKHYYQPDNAVLMIAGRFDEARVLKIVNEVYGGIPKPSRVLQPTYTVEPVQDGERSVTVRRSGGTQFVGAGYHTAPAGHADAAALAMLGRILSDAPSGRLHKALVDTKLATQVQYGEGSNPEPSFTMFGAVVPKDGNLDRAQEAMLNVLENLKAQPITDAELVRAKQQVSKGVELALADTSRLTLSLTESMAEGDWRLFFLNRDQAEKVTVADVQAAAAKYLKPSNRTLGRFIPTDAPDRTEVPNTLDVAALVKDYKGRAVVAAGEVFDPTPANIESRTERSTLPGGMKLALLSKKNKGEVVSVTMQLRLGTEESLRGKSRVGGFAGSLLSSGTKRLSRQEIKDAFDKLNAQVNIGGSAEGASVTITAKRDTLPAVIDLVAEILKTPNYPDKEFQEQQRAAINAAEQALPEPDRQAANAMQRLLDATPDGHVRHVGTLQEQLAEVKGITLEAVKNFYASHYGANNATFSAVGDFDAKALKAQLTKHFGDWKSQQKYVRIPDSIKISPAAQIKLETPDKANSTFFAVQPIPMKDTAEAYPALVIANHMLGGGTLRSRLADRIRQQEGLSYSVSSQFNARPLEAVGQWLGFAISAPQNTAKVEAAMRDELQKAVTVGFTEEELVEAKRGWKQAAEIRRSQDAGLAGRLAGYLTLDRTMMYDQDLETKVAALTLKQVNDTLRQHLKPENISVIKAGDFAKANK